jgi:hypothetical protein
VPATVLVLVAGGELSTTTGVGPEVAIVVVLPTRSIACALIT